MIVKVYLQFAIFVVMEEFKLMSNAMMETQETEMGVQVGVR